MRSWTKMISFLAIALVGAQASAGTIADKDVLRHVGQFVTVEGVVTGTHVSTRGTAFLDFGPRYPNQDFTVVVFARSAAALGDVGTYYGRRVDVTGNIELYRGRPEIVIHSASQLRVTR